MGGTERGAYSAPDTLYLYRFGDVEFDEAQFELRVGGLTVEIERKPLIVLLALLKRPGEVLSRADLLKAAWNGQITVDHALSNCMSKLRKALGPANEWRVSTVPKSGHRFKGDLERVAVGRQSLSVLQLQRGHSIAGREGVRLELLLGVTANNEIWMAHPVDNPEAASVYKFSRNGESLARLKRETTVHRFLMESLGARPDLVALKSWNFQNEPFYVETAYCGQNLSQWAAAGRLETLDFEARLALFLQIADAVAAAHSVGVLHKDLKPSNIFVESTDRTARLKVGDFGNSSMLDPDRLAEFGIARMGMTVAEQDARSGLSGTPFYLAPELMLDSTATVRSDIYALGVLLWQIVLEADCRRPMASGWEAGCDDAFLIEDIQVATAGDPQRRVASAAELTTRLRSRTERKRQRDSTQAAMQREVQAAKALEKARLRRPWVMISMAAMALGLGASVYLYQAERAARHRAELGEARVESTNAFLTDMLHRADPTAPGGEAHATIESAIIHAQESLSGRFRNDPATKGSIDLTLAEAFFGQSQYGKALAFNQEALSLLTASLGPHDPATLTAAYKLAGNLDMLSLHQEANVILEQADQAAGPLLHAPSPLSYLASSVRGGNYLLQMQAAPALEQFLTSERVRAAVAPDNEEWLVHVRSDIAWCEVRLNRSAEALDSLSVLMSPAYSPDRIGMAEWMKLHLQYGIALSNVGQYRDAERVLQTAEREAERRLGTRSYFVGLAFNYLATFYKTEGNWAEASRAADEEIRVFAALGPNHQSVLGSALDKAVINYLDTPDERTYLALARAQEGVSRTLGTQVPITQYANFYLATAALERGKLELVAPLLETLDPTALASADISPDWPARVDALRGWYQLTTEDKAGGTRRIRAALVTLSAHADPSWMSAPLKRALLDTNAS